MADYCDDPDYPDYPDYDDPTTFRGQLQRGRGIAARRAPGEPRAGEAVYECVIDDPRWDRQTESRDTYLAGLVVVLDLPLTPIEEHLAAFDGDEPNDISLLLGVLARLARDGHADAVGAVRRYLANGKFWDELLDALVFAERGPTPAPDVVDDLVGQALGHRTDDEFRDLIENGGGSWIRIVVKRHPELLRFFPENTAPGDRTGRDEHRRWMRTIRDHPREELLVQIERKGLAGRSAMEELGRRGDLTVVDLVEDLGRRDPTGWIPGASQALEHLGPAAVPRARLWLSRDDTLAGLGLRVLAGSGGHTDVPKLMSALRSAFDDDDLWCFAEIPAKGLGRLQVTEAAPLLHAAWERTVHSRARAPFLTALRACEPRGAQALAQEGLSDCEHTVRSIASG